MSQKNKKIHTIMCGKIFLILKKKIFLQIYDNVSKND